MDDGLYLCSVPPKDRLGLMLWKLQEKLISQVKIVVQRQDELLLGVSKFSVKGLFKQKFHSHFADNCIDRVQDQVPTKT